MTKNEYVISLRELADFIESKPLPDNWTGSSWSGIQDTFSHPFLQLYAYDKKEFGNIALALGTFNKETTDYYVKATVKLSLGATITYSIPHEQVCKKIVIGTKVIPAKEAEVIEAEPEREEQIIKWE